MKTITTEQINAQASLVLTPRQPVNNQFSRVLPPEQSQADSLVFISKNEGLQLALKNDSRGFILSENLWTELQGHKSQQIPPTKTIWTTKSIQQAMSCILPLFDPKTEFLQPGIHPSAVVHPTARIATTAHIGAHAVIAAHAQIGENSIIHSHVYIGHHCEIGQRCELLPHTVIGSDGFGYFTDKTGLHYKIPQIGIVVIEDDCDLGAHCAVDRATLTETRIKKGSKLDNFCHVSHNVEIGENALIAAGFIVAGSTHIGKNLTAAGGVHINGHIQVADHVILSGRAGVTNNITKSGIYGGFPLEPHKESIRTLTSLPHIKILRKQVKQILKHLNLNPEE